eukprot:gene2896-3326_t
MSHVSRSSKRSNGTHSSSLSDLFKFTRTLESGAFSVLYAMTKGNTFPKLATILSIMIEYIIFVSFGFKLAFVWGGDTGYWLKTILSPFSHPSNLFHYYGFTVLFWVVISLMCLGFLNMIYVGYRFHQGRIASILYIRTLRWFVSTSVNLLYIPILSLFLISLNCSRDDKGDLVVTRFMRFDEDIACWNIQNAPIAVVSILFIVIFSIISFVSNLTYYEYDTNNRTRYAKPHARFDVSIMIVKTIFTFTFEFARESPYALSIVYIIGISWLVFGTIYFLPYNNQRINQIKAGLYTSILWIALMSLITTIVNNQHSAATSYVVIVGFIPAFLPGFFGSRFYYRFLGHQLDTFLSINSARVGRSRTKSDALKTSSDNNGAVVSPAARVTWAETQLGSKGELTFPFLERFFTMPTTVEIMARRLLSDSNTPESIERANALFHCGLQYYPRSPLLWMAYTNFLMSVRKDRHVGYAALEKLRGLAPALDVRFFIYQRDREREQMMDSDLRGPDAGKIHDFIAYMEFKKLYTGARRSHVACLEYIRRFWRHLVHDTVDLNRLSSLSSKIASAERKASEQYERLVSLNPSSVRVLRDYSHFLEEVVRDSDMAFRLAKRADKIEERMSKSLSSEMHLEGSRPINSDDKDGVELGKMGSDSKSRDDTSEHSKSSSGRTSNRYERFQQSNSIRKLSWLTFITSLILIAFLITGLVYMRDQAMAQKFSFQGVVSLGEASAESVDIATNLERLRGMVFRRQYLTPNFEILVNDTHRRLNVLSNIHRAIYWGEDEPQSFVGDTFAELKRQAGIKLYDIGDEVFTYGEFNKTRAVDWTMPLLYDLYDMPSVELTTLIAPFHGNSPYSNDTGNGTSPFTTMKYNMWKAANLYIQSARAVLSYQETQYYDTDSDPIYQFAVINGPRNISSGFLDIQVAYIETVKGWADYIVNVAAGLWAGVFLIFVLLAVFLFRPVVSTISRETIRTLILFSMAPRDLVLSLSSKKYKLNVALESSSDRDLYDEDEVEGNANDVGTDDDKAPLIQESATTAPEPCTSAWTINVDDVGHRRHINKRSLRSVLRRLHLSYILALFVLWAIFTMSVGVSIVEVYNDYDSGPDLAKSAQRYAEAHSINFYVYQLINNHLPESTVEIQTYVDIMQDTHQSITYIPETRKLMMDDAGCLMIDQSLCRLPNDTYYQDSMMGLDWVIDKYIKTVISIAYASVEDQSYDDPEVEWFMSMADYELHDGNARATFEFFELWQSNQSYSINIIIVAYAVGLVAVCIAYFALFRSFITRLRIQHTHTLAMLRLAPKEIQMMEISDKIIDED